MAKDRMTMLEMVMPARMSRAWIGPIGSGRSRPRMSYFKASRWTM